MRLTSALILCALTPHSCRHTQALTCFACHEHTTPHAWLHTLRQPLCIQGMTSVHVTAPVWITHTHTHHDDRN